MGGDLAPQIVVYWGNFFDLPFRLGRGENFVLESEFLSEGGGGISVLGDRHFSCFRPKVSQNLQNFLQYSKFFFAPVFGARGGTND